MADDLTAASFTENFRGATQPTLGVVVGWESRGRPETRVDLDASAILDAASRAQDIWP